MKAIIVLLAVILSIFHFSQQIYAATDIKQFTWTKSVKVESETYIIRAYHDGYWWLQLYDYSSDALIYEWLDPDQS